MTVEPITNTRSIVVLWGLLLLAVLLTCEAFTVGLQRYAEQRREQDYHTYLNEALRLVGRNDYAGAMNQVNEALKRAQGVPEPYVQAGHIHYRLKQWEQAVAAYRKAIELGSPDKGVRLNAVWSLIELKQYDQATALGRQALAEGISSPALPRYVGEAYSRGGKPAEAIPFYEEALKGYPNDLYLLDHLRQAYSAVGNAEKATQMRNRIADVEARITTIGAGGQ